MAIGSSTSPKPPPPPPAAAPASSKETKSATGGGAPQGGGSTYHINKGDTLWGIADKVRQGGDTRGHWDIINEIARDNKIANPNLIYAGNDLQLRRPIGGGDTFTPAPAGPTTGGAPPAGGVDGNPGPTGRTTPFISQYAPTGSENGGYRNGDANCGPTAMAMIARGYQLGGNGSDAKLINQLGAIGGTDETGTSGNGLIAMAEHLGLKTGAAEGANVDWAVSQLQQGKYVIANGDYWEVPEHRNGDKTSGHYVLLTGLDQNGNVRVLDPADASARVMTLEQLRQYEAAHPNGGFNISVWQ